MIRRCLALPALAIVAAAALACGRADSNTQAAAPDQSSQRHLEMLTAPLLVGCAVDAAYFRVGLNIVDGQNNPVGLPLTQGGDSRGFRVSTDGAPSKMVYASAAGDRGQSQGASVLLLFDASGSMVTGKIGPLNRFVVAKNAVQRSLDTFVDGVDRLAVVPFESHSVADRIRRAKFQDTGAGVLAQLEAIPTPKPQNNTALFSAIAEAIPALQKEAESGRSVALVVFTDGKNDVGHVKDNDDPGLLAGAEGLQNAKEAARKAGIPVFTIGFGLTDQPDAVTTLQDLAFPTSDHYKDAANDPSVLTEILNKVRIKLSNRYQVFFGPVRTRQELAGGSVEIRVDLDANGERLSSPLMIWQSPGSGDPAPQTRCSTTEESKVLTTEPTSTLKARLVIFGLYAAILVALWFAAPRFMWPDAYIPRPTIPTAPVPTVPGVGLAAPPSPQMPRPDFSSGRNPPPGRSPGPAAPPGRPLGDRSATSPPTLAPERAIVIPRGTGRPASPPSPPSPPSPAPRQAPRLPDDERGASDETIYSPLPKRPPEDR